MVVCTFVVLLLRPQTHTFGHRLVHVHRTSIAPLIMIRDCHLKLRIS